MYAFVCNEAHHLHTHAEKKGRPEMLYPILENGFHCQSKEKNAMQIILMASIK